MNTWETVMKFKTFLKSIEPSIDTSNVLISDDVFGTYLDYGTRSEFYDVLYNMVSGIQRAYNASHPNDVVFVSGLMNRSFVNKLNDYLTPKTDSFSTVGTLASAVISPYTTAASFIAKSIIGPKTSPPPKISSPFPEYGFFDNVVASVRNVVKDINPKVDSPNSFSVFENLQKSTKTGLFETGEKVLNTVKRTASSVVANYKAVNSLIKIGTQQAIATAVTAYATWTDSSNLSMIPPGVIPAETVTFMISEAIKSIGSPSYLTVEGLLHMLSFETPRELHQGKVYYPSTLINKFGYSGLFQFGRPAWIEVSQKYKGIPFPSFQSGRLSPWWNIMAAVCYAQINALYLMRVTNLYKSRIKVSGVEITPQILYLAHNQGPAGAKYYLYHHKLLFGKQSKNALADFKTIRQRVHAV